MIVANRDQLLTGGHTQGRKLALDIIDRTMEMVDASRLTADLIHLEGDILTVGDLTYDLSSHRSVYVLGAGKGVLQIAEGLEHVLGDRIRNGLIIEKHLNRMAAGLERIGRFERVQVLQASHPVPDEDCVKGAMELVRLAESAGEDDLVFCCVQGGCSCLTTLPQQGLNLEDIQATTEIVLACGADITTLDAIRMAITRLRGGHLARIVHPAEIINLVVNDFVWRFPEGWQRPPGGAGWGPCVPVSDAVRTRHESTLAALPSTDLWQRLPERVRQYLAQADPSDYVQTVQSLKRAGIRYHTFVLAEPQDGAEAAHAAAQELGIESMILSSAVEGEAVDVGIMYAGIAKEIYRNQRPLPPPCTAVLSGEMTVTIAKEHGEGGRNQECVLSAALKIDGSDSIVIASVGTDGTDGPTDIAGGIVDGSTVRRAQERGIDIREQLQTCNSSAVLTELGDAIRFNQPGNNLCDLSLICVA